VVGCGPEKGVPTPDTPCRRILQKEKPSFSSVGLVNFLCSREIEGEA